MVNIFLADIILLVLWLCGSVFAGLMTTCALRVSDLRDYNTNRATGTAGGLHEPPDPPLTSRNPPRLLRLRRFLRRWRSSWRWRGRGPFATSSDETEADSSGGASQSAFVGSDIYENFPPLNARQQEYDQQPLLQSSYAWPPQPLTDRPLAPVPPSERCAFLDR